MHTLSAIAAMKPKQWVALCCCISFMSMTPAAQADSKVMVTIPGGTFESVLRPAEGVKKVTVKAFKLDPLPITNGDFARFVAQHPEWQRDRVARVFADTGYLNHWLASGPDKSLMDVPIVNVSWFAASAYCEARGARMPTWYEWEYVAAASETQRDARTDPAWRQRILNWYSTSGRAALPKVGSSAPNVYGVHDMHGVVWEWIEDVSGMLVSSDNRQQGDPETMRFCGTGALTMEQKENYAILMRIAMLSSMQAKYTSATMGFRCAVDGEKK